jgi:eukaryotic-like serine/threonine-protein kinase
VYKARDTRLDRTVAVKVLHEILARDPQFGERFARDAKAISSLNHAHICALYDIGEQEVASGQPVRYLVIEHLEARPLRIASAAAPFRSTKRWRAASKSPARSTRRIAPASCTAISSRAT